MNWGGRCGFGVEVCEWALAFVVRVWKLDRLDCRLCWLGAFHPPPNLPPERGEG